MRTFNKFFVAISSCFLIYHLSGLVYAQETDTTDLYLNIHKKWGSRINEVKEILKDEIIEEGQITSLIEYGKIAIDPDHRIYQIKAKRTDDPFNTILYQYTFLDDQLFKLEIYPKTKRLPYDRLLRAVFQEFGPYEEKWVWQPRSKNTGVKTLTWEKEYTKITFKCYFADLWGKGKYRYSDFSITYVNKTIEEFIKDFNRN
ncbi:hypothetical protein ISS37_10580 [candidate division KSB1 bacterium]|nr:hypothetical protein [candidate division KSB1 bacterium]